MLGIMSKYGQSVNKRSSTDENIPEFNQFTAFAKVMIYLS